MYISAQQRATITKKPISCYTFFLGCHYEVSLCFFFSFFFPILAPSTIFFFRLKNKRERKKKAKKQTTIERKRLTKITKV